MFYLKQKVPSIINYSSDYCCQQNCNVSQEKKCPSIFCYPLKSEIINLQWPRARNSMQPCYPRSKVDSGRNSDSEIFFPFSSYLALIYSLQCIERSGCHPPQTQSSFLPQRIIFSYLNEVTLPMLLSFIKYIYYLFKYLGVSMPNNFRVVA